MKVFTLLTYLYVPVFSIPSLNLEWNLYARDDLELFIFQSIRKHFSKTNDIYGSVTTIGEITTKIEYWNLKLWLKKVSDTGTYPDSKDYFWMLLDWRPYRNEAEDLMVLPVLEKSFLMKFIHKY